MYSLSTFSVRIVKFQVVGTQVSPSRNRLWVFAGKPIVLGQHTSDIGFLKPVHKVITEQSTIVKPSFMKLTVH
jgi:hypothetical protein